MAQSEANSNHWSVNRRPPAGPRGAGGAASPIQQPNLPVRKPRTRSRCTHEWPTITHSDRLREDGNDGPARMDAHKCRCDLARTTDLQQSDGVGKLLQIPTLAGLVLMASVTFAVAAAAQQPAPPPLVQPAPAPDVPTEQAVPAPLVVPAEQVAPVELTGLLGYAVVGVGEADWDASSICWRTVRGGCAQSWWEYRRFHWCR